MTVVLTTYGQPACTGHGGCAAVVETSGAVPSTRERILVAEGDVRAVHGAREFPSSSPTQSLSASGIPETHSVLTTYPRAAGNGLDGAVQTATTSGCDRSQLLLSIPCAQDAPGSRPRRDDRSQISIR